MSLDWNERFNRALQDQHKQLFDYDRRTIRDEYAQYTDCPVCGSAEASLYCEKDWFRFQRCKSCSMVYLNPRLNDAATHQFYNSPANDIYNEGKFDTVSTSSELDDRINLANLERIIRHRGSAHGSLLEVGSAKGYFLQKARERGFLVHGLELNEFNWRRSRDLLGDTIRNVDLMDAHYPVGIFDVIYLRDLIAHLPNPKAFLAECSRIAKPGCTLFIDTHNIDGLIHRVVKGRHTVVFAFMEPCHWSPRTIETLCEATGFSVRDVEFESIDCTVGDMLGYFRDSTFTTVYPPKVPPLRRFAVRLLHSLFRRWPLRVLDRGITPRIADLLKQGSVMRILAEKRAA